MKNPNTCIIFYLNIVIGPFFLPINTTTRSSPARSRKKNLLSRQMILCNLYVAFFIANHAKILNFEQFITELRRF